MKIIFLGTPDFAVPSLRALYENGHEILAVVCQPDKAGNRGKVSFCPIKVFALEHNIPVLQFEKIRRDGVEILKDLAPELMITCAYGQIISQEILDIPKYGVINVHGSLLPKYRGASPIQQAVLDGEKETGITIMKTVYAVDAGDILLVEKTQIGENETAGELFDRLAEIGGNAILKAVKLIEKGKAIYIPQEHDKATFCKMLTKEEGRISFDMNYNQISSFVRGMNPWPSAFTFINDKLFKIHQISYFDYNGNEEVGTILFASAKKGLIIKIKDCAISLDIIQPEGSKRMSSKDYLMGHTIIEGIVIK